MNNKSRSTKAKEIMELPLSKREEALNKTIEKDDVNSSIIVTRDMIKIADNGNEKANEANREFLAFCDNALGHA